MYLWVAVHHTIEEPALGEGLHMTIPVNNWYVQLLLQQLLLQQLFLYQQQY